MVQHYKTIDGTVGEVGRKELLTTTATKWGKQPTSPQFTATIVNPWLVGGTTHYTIDIAVGEVGFKELLTTTAMRTPVH